MDGHNGNVPVTPVNGGAFYGSGQYQSPPQSQHQTPQTEAWPGVVETPYYSGGANRGSTSSQTGDALAASHSSQTPQTPQYGYDPTSNYYYYPDPPPISTPVEQGRPSDNHPVSPDSAQRQNCGIDTSGGEASDLDDLMAKIQEAIDAKVVDGVHNLVDIDFSLGRNALIPLLRPVVGPFREGGPQDIPPEFHKNYPEETSEDNQTRETNLDDPPQQQQEQQQQQPDQQEQNESNQDATQNGEASSQPQRPPPFRQNRPADEDPLKKCPRATVEEIMDIKSDDLAGIIHRAASRGIVQRISNHDGFKYMFNNVWTSRADNDGLRFSYICRDSFQNKDRLNHVPSRASTQAASVRGEPQRRVKPIWDCKGTLGIKFSANRGVMIIQYRHAAIHPTHAERKPPPRKQRGDGSGRPRGRPRGTSAKKRKRDDGTAPVTSTSTAAFYGLLVDREPSLFELLQQSAIENAQQQVASQLGDTSRPWWDNS